MEKDRLAGFMDAMLPIIMTFLVLELEIPEAATWGGIWNLRNNYFSYALSFFWLGTMWVTLHNEWHYVEKISKAVVWESLILLFFSSLLPYSTSFVYTHFNNITAQLFYGIVVMAVTVCNMCMNVSLEKVNLNNEILKQTVQNTRKRLILDLGIKIFGIAIAVVCYPPAVMISVLLTIVLFMVRNEKKEAVY